jgi:hypothetical protein
MSFFREGDPTKGYGCDGRLMGKAIGARKPLPASAAKARRPRAEHAALAARLAHAHVSFDEYAELCQHY